MTCVLQHMKSRRVVVPNIVQRVGDRVHHRDLGREVDDAGRGAVLPLNRGHRGPQSIDDIRLHDRELVLGKELQVRPTSRREVVEHDDMLPLSDQVANDL